MGKYGRLLGQLIFLLVLAVGAFSWIQFLWPPLARFAATNDFWSVLLELLKPVNQIYPGMIFGGWLFLCVSGTSLILLGVIWRSALAYIEHSQVAISVLETDVNLSFSGPLMVDATLVRRQLIHANQYNVRSYRSAIATTGRNGQLVDGSFSAVSEANGDLLTKEVLLIGGGKSMELIEVYKRPLPVNYFLTYLPNGWAHGLRVFFKRSVVERRTRLCLQNEYNGPEATLSVTADRFPVANVTMRIAFPNETAPDRLSIRAFLIKDNIADEIDVIPDYSHPDQTIFKVRRSTLRQAMLRITWRNDNLLAYGNRLASSGNP